MSTRLTRYPEGSVRELSAISFPLMISALASLCMIFTDRLFLAHYSLDALNAVVNAGTLSWALVCGFGTMTGMAEVFVAQYNGAGQVQRIGVPVWQMIWLTLFSYAVFIPLSVFAPEIFSFNPTGPLEAVFFRWMMMFGPSYALMAAFSGFLIGRGKTKILIIVGVLANACNILLDWALIFGVDPFIPPLGVKGAAIATSFGYFLQAAILAVIFLRKKHREEFGTNRWQLEWDEFKKMILVAFPQGIFVMLEIFGWAVFFWMMTSMSKTHITVSSICQSLVILFSFFCDGLSRGVAAVAGNFIGGKRHHLIGKTMRSGLLLQGIFTIVVAAAILFDAKDLIQFLFFEHVEDQTLMPTIHFCLILAMIYLFFEGVRWLFSGLLTAAGDTLFLMIAGSLSVWVGLLLPVYLIVVRLALPVEYAWLIACLYSFVLFLLYAVRFRRGAWKKIDLVQSASEMGIESVNSESP